MDSEYFDRLPDDLRVMVARIEAESGLEIKVEVDESRAGKHSGEPDPLACVVNEHEAQLLIPSPASFPDGAVLHELLHIQRFLIEGVPQIAVCENHWNPELESVYTHLDNNLEHLVIVPRELAQRPERRDRWIAVMTRVLADLQSVRITTPDRDFLAIYGSFFVEHILEDQYLVNKYAAAALSFNLVGRTIEFGRTIAPALSSKEATIRACVEQFHLAEEFLCLNYYDPWKGTRQQCQLP